MADKINVKLLLELRQANMSQRAIAASRHISTKSVAAVWKRADALGVSYADVADKSDDEVYLLFFPDKFRKETVYAPVNYEYVHNELKKTGVTLKLLWQEYKDSAKDGVPVGYTKFCDDYAKYVEQNNLTNHITHKPGVVCEVDWSGKTMRLNDSEEGKVHPVYLFVAALPYSQLAYVEPCLNMNEQTWISAAKFRIADAALVNVYYEKRGLDKDLILTLGSCGFIEKNQPVVFNGFTGSGKSYLACAIGRQACMQGFRTRYIRVPDLMQLLSEASLDVHGRAKLLKKFSGYRLLILDEWLLNDMTESEQHFIFELIERRYDCTSTIFCTQYKREDWHSRLGGGIHADAIMDRIVHTAAWVYSGDINMRELQAKGAES